MKVLHSDKEQPVIEPEVIQTKNDTIPQKKESNVSFTPNKGTKVNTIVIITVVVILIAVIVFTIMYFVRKKKQEQNVGN